MAEPTGDWPEWVKDWVIPYLEDSILWPVAFALLAHVLIVFVPLELQIYRYQSIPAAILLVIFLSATGSLIRMELRAMGKPWALTASLVLLWLSSLPVAWWCETTGVI